MGRTDTPAEAIAARLRPLVEAALLEQGITAHTPDIDEERESFADLGCGDVCDGVAIRASGAVWPNETALAKCAAGHVAEWAEYRAHRGESVAFGTVRVTCVYSESTDEFRASIEVPCFVPNQ